MDVRGYEWRVGVVDVVTWQFGLVFILRGVRTSKHIPIPKTSDEEPTYSVPTMETGTDGSLHSTSVSAPLRKVFKGRIEKMKIRSIARQILIWASRKCLKSKNIRSPI